MNKKVVKILIISKNINYLKEIINALSVLNCYTINIALDTTDFLKMTHEKHFDFLICNISEDFEKLDNYMNCVSNKTNIILVRDTVSQKKYRITTFNHKIVNFSELESVVTLIKNCKNDSMNNIIYNEVLKELLYIGFDFKYKGTSYLLQSIVYVLSNRDLQLLNNLEKDLYPVIAKLNNTNINNVKTNITKATNWCYQYNRNENYTKYFLPNIKHTPKTNISIVSNKLNNKLSLGL